MTASDPDSSAHAEKRGVVLLADPTAEAEAIARGLRAAGFSVVDAPLALLEARVRGESPAAIVLDLDQTGALEVLERVSATEEGAGAAIVCVGDAARRRDAGGAGEDDRMFGRPVDIARLVEAVRRLADAAEARARAMARYELHRPSRSPAAEAAERSGGSDEPAAAEGLDIGALLPELDDTEGLAELAAVDVSPELSELLANAERRVVAELEEPLGPGSSRDGTADVMLPAEVLGALDEPLDPGDEGPITGLSSGPGTSLLPAGTGRGPTVTPQATAVPSTAGPEGPPASRKPVTTLPPTNPARPRFLETSQPPRVPTAPPTDRDRAGASARPLPDEPAEPRAPSADERAQTSDEASGHGRAASVLPRWGAGRSATPSSPALAHERSATLSPGAPGQAEPPSPGAPPEAEAPPRCEGAIRTPVPHAQTAPLAARAALRGMLAPPVRDEAGPLELPAVLGEGDALHALAKAVAERASGCLALSAREGPRRIVLHDGDIVTAGSGLEGETLVAFLAARGDISRDVAARLAGKLPPTGRHAGAALVANGHLGQDDLWPTLRAHAEWIIGHAVSMDAGTCELEPEPPGRLKAEPSVFGGATGAEVLVETVRRVVPPEAALRKLGGRSSLLAAGPRASLLGECALQPEEVELVRAADGHRVEDILVEPETANLLHALVALGVLETKRPATSDRGKQTARADPLDEQAVRERVRARMALVEEGDYFALLGVSRSATSYEIRRAYVEARRAFEPSRLLTAATADLADDVRVVLDVLEEAYEILREPQRRDRYRRAIEAGPP